MVRQRKTVTHKSINNETSSSSGSSESSFGSKTFKFLSVWKTGVGFVCFLIAVYISTLGYLETRVNTPFDDDKVIFYTIFRTLSYTLFSNFNQFYVLFLHFNYLWHKIRVAFSHELTFIINFCISQII